MPATCWNCKTPKMMTWIKQYGDEFWSKDVNEFRGKDKIDAKEESISCATCHDPKSMELRLYSEPLKDWLKRSGKDWNNISRNEKRTLVCAQCHVEYYFTHPDNGPKLRPVFPWDKGMNPEDMYEYYKGHGKKDASGQARSVRRLGPRRFQGAHDQDAAPGLRDLPGRAARRSRRFLR